MLVFLSFFSNMKGLTVLRSIGYAALDLRLLFLSFFCTLHMASVIQHKLAAVHWAFVVLFMARKSAV